MDPWMLVDHVCNRLCTTKVSTLALSSKSRKRSRHDDFSTQDEVHRSMYVLTYRQLVDPILEAFQKIIAQPMQWRLGKSNV